MKFRIDRTTDYLTSENPDGEIIEIETIEDLFKIIRKEREQIIIGLHNNERSCKHEPEEPWIEIYDTGREGGRD